MHDELRPATRTVRVVSQAGLLFARRSEAGREAAGGDASHKYVNEPKAPFSAPGSVPVRPV